MRILCPCSKEPSNLLGRAELCSWHTGDKSGALYTGGDGGDWQRSPEEEQAFKVSLEQQQDLRGGRRYGGRSVMLKQHNCLWWMESTLSGSPTVRGNREREGGGEVKGVDRGQTL